MSSKEGRAIGVRHRIKRTREGEAHPTQVAICVDGRFTTYDLETEQAELDFVHGRYPIKYRKATANDDLSQWPSHQLKTRKVKPADDPSSIPENLRIYSTKDQTLVTAAVTEVPEALGGLQPFDTMVMTLGGSGNNMAYAMSRRGLDINAHVFRVPPHVLKDFRGDDKTDDAKHLVRLFAQSPAKFYRVGKRDRNLISVQEAYGLREKAVKARIGIEQQLYQLVIGSIFCSEEGGYPEGEIEKLVDAERANDVVYQNAVKHEHACDRRLNEALNRLPVYSALFAPIASVGPAIAARIISVVGDIRLFWESPDEAEMALLFDEAELIERQYYDPIKNDLAIKAAVEGMDPFHRLGVVFKYYRRLNNQTATAAIAKATECHMQRSKLKQKAERDGQSNLKAFLGVHLVQNEEKEWVFPRQRRGARCNWSPTGRQGIFLFDYCVVMKTKDPTNYWAGKRAGYKKAFRERHPVVVEVQVPDPRKPGSMKTVKRYTDGHIHNMARWRLGTRFVEWLFKEWTRLELANTGGEL